MPRASIIIPCYNAEKYLSDTLRSAQSQTERDIEIICADNNSTDSIMLDDVLQKRIRTTLRSGEGSATSGKSAERSTTRTNSKLSNSAGRSRARPCSTGTSTK